MLHSGKNGPFCCYVAAIKFRMSYYLHLTEVLQTFHMQLKWNTWPCFIWSKAKWRVTFCLQRCTEPWEGHTSIFVPESMTRRQRSVSHLQEHDYCGCAASFEVGKGWKWVLSIVTVTKDWTKLVYVKDWHSFPIFKCNFASSWGRMTFCWSAQPPLHLNTEYL